jgi:arginase
MAFAMARPADPIGIDIVAVPYDSGQRGVRMGAGPLALAPEVSALLAQWGHPVEVTWAETQSTDPLDSAVELAAQVSRATAAARAAGRFPVVLSGNCVATVGAFAGVCTARSRLVWLDAHGDLNTPATSPSGFLDGMSAAILLGWCHADRFRAVPGHAPLDTGAFLLIGSRALDDGEQQAIAAQGVRLMTPAAAHDERAMTCDVSRFTMGASDVYIHFDLDVLDPAAHGAANSYVEPGGLHIYHAVRIIQEIAALRPISGITISAYDPAVEGSMIAAAAAVPLISECLLAAAPANVQ